jgi:hypothetical protein
VEVADPAAAPQSSGKVASGVIRLVRSAVDQPDHGIAGEAPV